MLVNQHVLLSQRDKCFVEFFWLHSLQKLFMYSKASDGEIGESLKPFTGYEASESVGHAAPCRIQECVTALWLPCKFIYKWDKVILEDNRHKQKDGKWNEFRSLLFLWVCFLSAQFHVGTFNHYSPWCEMNEIYPLYISDQYAFQFKLMTEHITHLPSFVTLGPILQDD